METLVKIVNNSKHELPKYANVGDAGMDLRANIDSPITLQPLDRIAVTTGLMIQLPENTEAQIRSRSGLAIKSGITVLNSPGTIDAGFTGEIKVILINLSDERFIIKDGDRIAQMVVAKHETVKWELVEVLGDTERGTGGLGSTGTN